MDNATDNQTTSTAQKQKAPRYELPLNSGFVYTESDSTHDSLKLLLKFGVKRSLGIGLGYGPPEPSSSAKYKIAITEIHRHRHGTRPMQGEEIGARVGDQILRVHKWDVNEDHTVQDVLGMLKKARKICPETFVVLALRPVRRLPYFGELDSVTLKLKGVGPVAELPALVSRMAAGAWIRVERRMLPVHHDEEQYWRKGSRTDDEVDYPQYPVVFTGSQPQLQVALSILRHTEYVFPDVAAKVLNTAVLLSRWIDHIKEIESKYDVKIGFSPLPTASMVNSLNSTFHTSPLQESAQRSNLRSNSELSLPEMNSSPPMSTCDESEELDHTFRDLSSLPPPSSVTGLCAIEETTQHGLSNNSQSGPTPVQLSSVMQHGKPYEEKDKIGIRQYTSEGYSEDGERESVSGRSVDTHSVAASQSSERTPARLGRRRGRKKTSWLATAGSAVIPPSATGLNRLQYNDTDSDSVECMSDTTDQTGTKFAYGTRNKYGSPGTYGLFVTAVPLSIIFDRDEDNNNPGDVTDESYNYQGVDIHESADIAVRAVAEAAYTISSEVKA